MDHLVFAGMLVEMSLMPAIQRYDFEFQNFYLKLLERTRMAAGTISDNRYRISCGGSRNRRTP